MSTDVTPYRNASLDEKYRYAQALAAAGDLLPRGLWENKKNADGILENRPSPGKVLLVAETGAMLGIHPMAALQGIDVIEGHPTIKPALMTALIRTAGHTLRIKKSGTIEDGDIAVTATLIRSDDPDFTYESTWRPADAIRAGLIDSYKPDANTGIWEVRARSDKNGIKPWEAYTPAMLRWRAVGDVAREGAEDVLMGVHYTAEELTSGASIGVMVQVPDDPAEDWAALIKDATTKQELVAIADRAKVARQFTDEIRTLVLARSGMLHRNEAPPAAEPEAEVVDAEIADDEPDAPIDVVTGKPATIYTPPEDQMPAPAELSEEEYERQAAAEFDARTTP